METEISSLAKIKETHLYYLWIYQLFNIQNLLDHNGNLLKIESAGYRNSFSGPDFFMSSVVIDGKKWVGSTEIHVNASEWYDHKHDRDPRYNNVVLHVVWNNNKKAITQCGSELPTLELKNRVAEKTIKRILKLETISGHFSCAEVKGNVNDVYIRTWLNRMVIEKLESKYDEIIPETEISKINWERVTWLLMAKAIWGNVNGKNAYLVFSEKNWRVLLKNRNSESELLLCLQFITGLADDNAIPAHKLKIFESRLEIGELYQLELHMWKKMGIRPVNHPAIKLEQIASLFHNSISVFQLLVELTGFNQFVDLINDSKMRAAKMSLFTQKSLFVNAVIPLMFIYGHKSGNKSYINKALSMLEKMKPETNGIIKFWAQKYFVPRNVLETQGIIHLAGSYCSQKKCVNCNIGIKLLQQDDK